MRSLRRLQRKKIPGMHRTTSPEAALTASTIVRISSIAGASSPDAPIRLGKYTDGVDEVIMKVRKAKNRNFQILYI